MPSALLVGLVNLVAFVALPPRAMNAAILAAPPSHESRAISRSLVVMRGRGRVNARGRARGRGSGSSGRGRGRGRRASSSPTPKPAVGDKVSVVEKANYGTELRTVGTVARVLTRAANHPRGHKVMLQNGVVGRCTQLIERVDSVEEAIRAPPSSEGEMSSEEYLASIDLTPPPPGIRLRDVEARRSRGTSLYLAEHEHAPHALPSLAPRFEGRRRALAASAALAVAALVLPATTPPAHAAPPMLKTVYTEDSAFVAWGPLKGLSDDEISRLEALSLRPDGGTLRADGTRVYDLVEGDGPAARKGDHVYVSYKVWSKGFRAGPVADWTYLDGRPYDWVLGKPTDRIPPAVDAALAGMREGGWRRLVVPEAYGSSGLRKSNPLKGGGRYTPPKAGFVIKPDAVAFFDVIMIDGGSGRCEALLAPPGLSEQEARKRRSRLCLPEELRVDDLRIV